MYEDVVKVFRENSKCHIYYHDNGAWIIYRHRPYDFEVFTGNSKDYDKYLASIVLLEGDDYTFSTGYCPSLVAALAKLGGFTVDSI